MKHPTGILIPIQENTLLHLGVAPNGPSYTVSGVRVEHGTQQAHIRSGNGRARIDQTLQVGESVTHPRVGTFTLVHIRVHIRTPGRTGGGGIATFAFEPAPGFTINPALLS
ncbi:MULTISPECIES: hypothetical protein [unclassified Actinobaculum]|uniref:hypothetical protein n=1 Tax=unclassified Actinobaculum TaxID=2609299 RepID=UPI000D529F70|nr:MULTISPECIES: hypothetical protein [unclassified Actinobaculum]AWE43144.1 hypothetical protein DDD63_10755 [Actinobaculum sp. 313]RTE48296.1 hypothetical protein EKN07_10430 [Actinobaculum sp. 352]